MYELVLPLFAMLRQESRSAFLLSSQHTALGKIVSNIRGMGLHRIRAYCLSGAPRLDFGSSLSVHRSFGCHLPSNARQGHPLYGCQQWFPPLRPQWSCQYQRPDRQCCHPAQTMPFLPPVRPAAVLCLGRPVLHGIDSIASVHLHPARKGVAEGGVHLAAVFQHSGPGDPLFINCRPVMLQILVQIVIVKVGSPGGGKPPL